MLRITQKKGDIWPKNKLKFVDFDRGWMRTQKEWYDFEYAAEKTAAVTRLPELFHDATLQMCNSLYKKKVKWSAKGHYVLSSRGSTRWSVPQMKLHDSLNWFQNLQCVMVRITWGYTACRDSKATPCGIKHLWTSEPLIPIWLLSSQSTVYDS